MRAETIRLMKWNARAEPHGLRCAGGAEGPRPPHVLPPGQQSRVLRIGRPIAPGFLSPAITRRLIGEFVARPPDRSTAPGPESLT